MKMSQLVTKKGCSSAYLIGGQDEHRQSHRLRPGHARERPLKPWEIHENVTSGHQKRVFICLPDWRTRWTPNNHADWGLAMPKKGHWSPERSMKMSQVVTQKGCSSAYLIGGQDEHRTITPIEAWPCPGKPRPQPNPERETPANDWFWKFWSRLLSFKNRVRLWACVHLLGQLEQQMNTAQRCKTETYTFLGRAAKTANPEKHIRMTRQTQISYYPHALSQASWNKPSIRNGGIEGDTRWWRAVGTKASEKLYWPFSLFGLSSQFQLKPKSHWAGASTG